MDNRKLFLLDKIIERYQEFIKELNQEESIKVISAGKLTAEQKGKVSKALEARLGHGNFVVEYEENPEIQGGLQIYFGDSFLDCSLGARISKIRDEISKVSL